MAPERIDSQGDDVSPAFDELIATALAKDPGNRFQTFGEFDAEVVPTAGVEQVTGMQLRIGRARRPGDGQLELLSSGESRLCTSR